VVPLEKLDIDMQFHGDILLIGDNGSSSEYIARFTHGTLEWIRPLDTFSETERSLVVCRSLEG
jgi:hypothetical protein